MILTFTKVWQHPYHTMILYNILTLQFICKQEEYLLKNGCTCKKVKLRVMQAYRVPGP